MFLDHQESRLVISTAGDTNANAYLITVDAASFNLTTAEYIQQNDSFAPEYRPKSMAFDETRRSVCRLNIESSEEIY